MAWSGSITANSAVGAKTTFTPGIDTVGGYVVSSFTAPRKGIYRLILRGSGGQVYHTGTAGAGGEGGKTTGYLLLTQGEKVYVGAGGPCSAAFAAAATGESLSAIAKSSLYFVAGGGGGGGAAWSSSNNNYGSAGGRGGGASGTDGETYGVTGGSGGTQSEGGSGHYSGAYGVGGAGEYGNISNTSHWKGRGGDGYYGGGSGYGSTPIGTGGGGGSGYVKTASLSANGVTYRSATAQGGGAASNAPGSVEVTYYAATELPVSFNGTKLTKLIFNGTEVKSLIYDGTRLFAQGLRRWKRCLT